MKKTKAVPFVRICAGLVAAGLLSVIYMLCLRLGREARLVTGETTLFELFAKIYVFVIPILFAIPGAIVFITLCLTGDTPSWMNKRGKQTAL